MLPCVAVVMFSVVYSSVQIFHPARRKVQSDASDIQQVRHNTRVSSRLMRTMHLKKTRLDLGRVVFEVGIHRQWKGQCLRFVAVHTMMDITILQFLAIRLAKKLKQVTVTQAR